MQSKIQVRTTVDILKGVEKRRYEQPSEVIVRNMYQEDINNIPKLNEINVTPRFLDSIRKFHSDKTLAKYFGMSRFKFRRYMKKIYKSMSK